MMTMLGNQTEWARTLESLPTGVTKQSGKVY